MAQHEGFSCPACGAEFDTREQLDDHNKREHQHGGAQSGSKVSGSGGGTSSTGGAGGGTGTQR